MKGLRPKKTLANRVSRAIFFGFFILLGLLTAGAAHGQDKSWPQSPEEKSAEEKSASISTGMVMKVLYTHRDRHEKSGVSGISEAALRFLEFDLVGNPSRRLGWRMELVAANGIYQDPILGTGSPAGPSNLGDIGSIGVRKAEILIHLGSVSTIRLGTFMPGWGAYQTRPTWDWDFVDLPLIYTRPEFKNLGWQNTGVELEFYPLGFLNGIDEQSPWIKLNLFYINGYFPEGLAGTEPLYPDGTMDRNKGMGGKLSFELAGGRLRIYGGYYQEAWEEDLKGSPAREEYEAAAWLAGADLKTRRFRGTVEWTDLVIDDYQLKLNGEWTALRTIGGHASVAVLLLDHWQALARIEWIDPNTADSKKTFNPSRFDQLGQWTVGVSYRFADKGLFMVNYVIPVEEGSQVDLDKGKVGGKYQVVENNYFRVQVQIWR